MSFASGRFRSPNRVESASTVDATSSSESVVCVITAVGVPDERDQVAAVGVTPRLGVNLRDERTDRVDDAQPAPLRVLLDGRSDPVGGEDADLARRDLVLALDEDGAQALEAPDDVLVVDDLVT